MSRNISVTVLLEELKELASFGPNVYLRDSAA